MPHHFLYLKNAYHILITKPSLPHLYLYYIQKLARNLRAISPKLARATVKNDRFLFPLLHPGNDKTIACELYLYYIQKISAQLARYFPEISAHNNKERQVPRRGGGGVEWCGDPWVALVLSPSSHPNK